MTHLLDIFWLILFLPSLYICLRRPSGLKFTQSFFAMIGVLVFLFPVISATDDLLLIKQEVEEPVRGKAIGKPVSEASYGNHICTSAVPVRDGNISPQVFVEYFTVKGGQCLTLTTTDRSFSNRAPPFRHA